MKKDKLRIWQERLEQSDAAMSAEVIRMDQRERLYAGSRRLNPMVSGDQHPKGKETPHVRNIVFENIESMVSSMIPAPKVTPRRKQDEKLAETIERFLRNEIDRLPFEEINDMAERTVSIQGGVGFLVEWDNTIRRHAEVGEVTVTLAHPKQLAPQPGIYTSIDDMDWIIIKCPTTKEAIRRQYGINVERESEAEPEVRTVGGGETAEDTVTEYIGFAKNDDGGIDRYAWVNDIELEDLEDYQARKQPVCRHCGRVRPLPGQIISADVDTAPAQESDLTRTLAGYGMASILAGETEAAPEGLLPGIEVEDRAPKEYQGGACPWCGSDEWEDREQEYEQIMVPIATAAGTRIEGMTPGFDGETGAPVMQPTLVPFYKPGVYPIVLQRSVSVYGQLLGNSDVDVIADQQNTVNRLEKKVIDRLMKAGTRITLPAKASFRNDPEDGERWFLDNPADKAMIGVLDFSGNLQYEMQYLANTYEEARQLLGITDSFQGRRDTTAISGTAKQFAAAQSAGRLESKRIMKNATYARIYELMFKFWLAYSDEPRPIVYKNSRGENEYQEFNRYDFLERDEDGTYWWNDQFLFSCDSNDALTNNREALWQEARANFQSGAFGNPAATETLVLFWSKLEALHYPGAGETKAELEQRLERERQMQMQQAQMQQMQAQQMQPGMIPTAGGRIG